MNTKDEKYTRLLNKQIDINGRENRHLEFKSNYQDADRLGRYISALSNGACLDNEDFAYLFFGVEDETLNVNGTTFLTLRTRSTKGTRPWNCICVGWSHRK